MQLPDVLFGDADPSGKLPVSFVKEWKDSPAYGHYPGENLQVDYAEGIYVGYRYFDKQKVEPSVSLRLRSFLHNSLITAI